MVIGSLRLVVRIHGCRSLKEKRRPRQRITERIRSKFKVAVAETDTQDVWDTLTLGVAAVGPDRLPVERVLKQVADFVANFGEGELVEDVIELDLR